MHIDFYKIIQGYISSSNKNSVLILNDPYYSFNPTHENILIKIQKSEASTYTILVSDQKKAPNLNTVLKQINKHKLNVIEANFQKVNLEKIFRTITTGKN